MRYNEDSSDIWQQQDQKRKIKVIHDSSPSTNTMKVVYISKNEKHLNDHKDKPYKKRYVHALLTVKIWITEESLFWYSEVVISINRTGKFLPQILFFFRFGTLKWFYPGFQGSLYRSCSLKISKSCSLYPIVVRKIDHFWNPGCNSKRWFNFRDPPNKIKIKFANFLKKFKLPQVAWRPPHFRTAWGRWTTKSTGWGVVPVTPKSFANFKSLKPWRKIQLSDLA